jgi:hypothetical protein
MASCGMLIKDFFNNGLEPNSAEDVTNLARDVLRIGIMLTCLKQKRLGNDLKDEPENMTGQIKSSGRKILAYMQSKGFSGFRKNWQQLNLKKQGGEIVGEDLI